MLIKIIGSFLAGTILAGGGAAVAASSGTPENAPRWMTSPCQYEDSRNCFWNAGEVGNHQGHSFYSVRINAGMECTVYWNNKYARKHNFCTNVGTAAHS